ncbi:MAG: alanine dehydrogenase [Chloroflexi bacterium]|nr:alanine dehydrogenase [Chloroflexota bacterium]
MEFGVPKEVRDLEMRVGLAPSGVLSLVKAGHTVYVESKAGLGAGFSDEVYRDAGANIVYTAAEVYGRSDVVAKLARPTKEEHRLFRPGQMIFSFLHLPVASPDLFEALAGREITAVAYEMIEDDNGELPVLISASQVAGRFLPTIAGQLLRSDRGAPGQGGGRGILLSGIPGVPPAAVVVIGGGTLGMNAAAAFMGLGAEVTVLDRSLNKLKYIDERFNGRITTMFANKYNIQRAAKFADVLVGAVLIPGQRSPILVTREMVKSMRPGSVIMDFSIDEGGCVETSRPTTLRDPSYILEGVVHYCVPNMTSVVARTATYAITNAALPYLRTLGEYGLIGAIHRESALVRGINLYQGNLADPAVAAALGREVTAKFPRSAGGPR